MHLRRAQSGDLDRIVALQHEAYAENAVRLGATPIPMATNYEPILRDMEVWLADDAEGLTGALILEYRADDMLIWSVATHPRARATGVGKALLAFAEQRAREEGRATIRLYTASVYTDNIAWYGRHGFAIESREARPDRVLVNMKKTI